jgi:hypothetical protein
MNFLMQISNISAFDSTNPSGISLQIFLYLPIKSIWRERFVPYAESLGERTENNNPTIEGKSLQR